MNCTIVLAALLIWPAVVEAKCPHPVYMGLRHHVTMRFIGETGEAVFEEHGTIDIGKTRYTFSTTHSNGHGDEYIMIDISKQKQSIDSLVMRKNDDFTDSQKHESDYLITPDLPLKFYYLSDDRPLMDDTWKLISCDLARRP